MKSSTLWYEKYRPATVDDYVWTDEATKQRLLDWIADPLGYPSLLLAGPTGTGKTSLAKIIRYALKDRADFHFIPASLRSGADMIRDELVGFCEIGGFKDLKIIIMDECDRLSRDAQEMMRNVIDRFDGDVRFIFTANYPDKIAPPIRGRMWEIEIASLNEESFLDRLVDILDAECVSYEDDIALSVIDNIVQSTYPNMRKAISNLQWCVVDGEVTDAKPPTMVMPWENSLLGVFENFNIGEARRVVVSIPPNDFEQTYKVLYENSQIFGEQEQDAILIIADHLYKHSMAGLPDITLCSCLIQLSEME